MPTLTRAKLDSDSDQVNYFPEPFRSCSRLAQIHVLRILVSAHSFLLLISMSSESGTPDHLDPSKWADMLGSVLQFSPRGQYSVIFLQVLFHSRIHL